MSKAIKFRNGVYLDASSVWFSKFKGTMKDTMIFHTLNNIHISDPSHAGLRCLGTLKFTKHNQGEFCQLRIFLGFGNNGSYKQNAYIDLTMQMGWSGSDGGRVGCVALLYPFDSAFNHSNIKLYVQYINSITYKIYGKFGAHYIRPNIIMLAGSINAKFEPDYSEAPANDIVMEGTKSSLKLYQMPALNGTII